VIDEIFISDVVALEWEVLRWRHLKFSIFRRRELEELEAFLCEELDYDQYCEHFENDLRQVLQDNLEEDTDEHVAKKLAHDCAENKQDAVNKVNDILNGTDLDIDKILSSAKTRKAKGLAQEYAQREPGAVKLVHDLLTRAGMDTDALNPLPGEVAFDHIERIDHLTTIAEGRRNASLREIDRRRAILGEAMRRRMQEIEADEVKMIDATPAQGKTRLDERPQD
jgi:hypothetical protein